MKQERPAEKRTAATSGPASEQGQAATREPAQAADDEQKTAGTEGEETQEPQAAPAEGDDVAKRRNTAPNGFGPNPATVADSSGKLPGSLVDQTAQPSIGDTPDPAVAAKADDAADDMLQAQNTAGAARVATAVTEKAASLPHTGVMASQPGTDAKQIGQDIAAMPKDAKALEPARGTSLPDGAAQPARQATEAVPPATATALQQVSNRQPLTETRARPEAEDPADIRQVTDRTARYTELASTQQVQKAPVPTPVATVTAAVVSGQALANREELNKEKASSALTADGDLENLRFDARSSTGPFATTQPGAVAMTARSELPRMVASQINDAVRNMGGQTVDISLSPEELGRVRLSITAGENGVVLNVLAERQETLDLMRRHADMLARQLADLGFESIDLAFGQGQAQGESTDDGEGSHGNSHGDFGGQNASDDTAQTVQAPNPVSRQIQLNDAGGLDIRL